MANLRCSAAEESEESLNYFTSNTGYEPNLLTFGELNDSSVPFSFMIPSTDQEDDVTLGEMLTAAHRGQADYCGPEGMPVSQSSSSVMFDGSGQPDGERMVDQSGKSKRLPFSSASSVCGQMEISAPMLCRGNRIRRWREHGNCFESNDCERAGVCCCGVCWVCRCPVAARHHQSSFRSVVTGV